MRRPTRRGGGEHQLPYPPSSGRLTSLLAGPAPTLLSSSPTFVRARRLKGDRELEDGAQEAGSARTLRFPCLHAKVENWWRLAVLVNEAGTD